MPIRAEHRWLYAIDWPQLSAVIRFERAEGAASIVLGRMGVWFASSATVGGGTRTKAPGATSAGVWSRALCPSRSTTHRRRGCFLRRPTSTTTPANSHPRNPAALCQRCHLLHDRPEHQRRRWITMRMRRRPVNHFLGVYRA